MAAKTAPAGAERLAAQLDLLEQKIDAALELLARLRRENRRLAERVQELESARQQATRQLNTVIDRIDGLL